MTQLPELLFELLDGSLRTRDAWMNLTVGEHLGIPLNVRGAAVPELTRNFNPITKVAEAKIAVFPPERDVRTGESSSAGAGPPLTIHTRMKWRLVYHHQRPDPARHLHADPRESQAADCCQRAGANGSGRY